MAIQPPVGARFIAPDLPPDTSANHDIHHRRSIRLRGYDYSQAGAYFITVSTQNRECFFGEVVGEGMRFNDAGHIVQDVWDALPKHYSCVELDAFVVMPNHVHGVIVLGDVGAVSILHRACSIADCLPLVRFIAPNNVSEINPGAKNRPPTLGGIIRAFKARCTHSINQLRGTQGLSVWQRNYYEHIIRDEYSLQEIREYIVNNPAQWAFDRENPDAQFVAPNGEGAMPRRGSRTRRVNRAPTGLNGVKV